MKIVNELLAVQTRKIAKILVDRRDGKFLPDGKKNTVINIKSGATHAVLNLSPEDLKKFISAIQTDGKNTLQGVMA